MRNIYYKALLSAILLLSSVSALAYDFSVDGICYNILSSSTCEVTYAYGKLSYVSGVKIPSYVTYGGQKYEVIRIGNRAFRGGSKPVYEVIIPNSVTEIGEKAFFNCRSLEIVTLSNSLTRLESSLFEGCHELSKITIPNSVTETGWYVFKNCNDLKYVTLSNSMTNIGLGMFDGCSDLLSITIPNSVTEIGKEAFSSCI